MACGRILAGMDISKRAKCSIPVLLGELISVHVQANDVGGVDVGAFSSPSTETGDITQNWYESQIQGCFVKANGALSR